MKKNIIILIIILFLLTNFKLFSLPENRSENDSYVAGYASLLFLLNDKKFIYDAKLTKIKITRLREILLSAKKERIPLLAKLHVETLNFEQAFNENIINNDNIFNIAKKIHDISWELRKVRLNSMVLIAGLFNKQERKVFKNAMHKHFLLRYNIHSRIHASD